LAGLAALGVGALGASGTASVGAAQQTGSRQRFRVRIENTASLDTFGDRGPTNGALWITPGAYATHTGSNPAYTVGESASPGLEAIAEAGLPGGFSGSPGLLAELSNAANVTTTGAFTPPDTTTDPNDPTGQVPGAPPIAPGGAYEFTVTGAPGEAFTFATMLVPSNDAFYAADGDGIALFDANDEPISGDVTDQVGLYDAGTEPNTTPGTGSDQAPAQSSPDQGADEGGTVRPISEVANAGEYPAAADTIRVTVTPVDPQPFRVRIENTASLDTFGDRGPTNGALWITPGSFATHSGPNPAYTVGEPASPGLEAIAEAGFPDGFPGEPGLSAELAARSNVTAAGAFTPPDTVADPNDPTGQVPGAPPIAPGGAFEFDLTAFPGERLTFATMLVPSNDAFYAADGDGIALFDDAGDPVSGDVTDQVGLYDAGTEPNTTPGTGSDQAPAQSSPDQGADEDGTVQPISEVANADEYPSVADSIGVSVEPIEPVRFQVLVENVADLDTYGPNTSTGGAVWITPGAIAIHTGSNPAFTPGQPASIGLEAIAEAGPPTGFPGEPGLVDEYAAARSVAAAGAFTPPDTVRDPNDPQGSVPGAPPIAPGGAIGITIEGLPGHKFSFASMFVPSNDIFFAPGDGIALFDDAGDPVSGDVTDQVGLWDAGTEPNQEPGVGGDQAPAQSSPDQGADEGGVVRPLDEVNDGYSYPAVSDAIRVRIQPVPETLPGGRGRPTDPDGDGAFEDVDGDGAVTYNDVVTLFENADDPTVQAGTDFDINGNGRFDFNDVVRLFESR
jgi:hypothetical protein